jgi:DNA-binding MarR family transcriptional regulator
MLDPLTFSLGAASGAAVAVGGWALARWVTARTGRNAPPFVQVEPARTTEPNAGPSSPAEDAAPTPRPGVGAGAERVTGDQVRLSERIILSLAREGRLPPLGSVPVGRTQGGLAAAFAASQSSVSKVLARLVAAGVVEASRRFVQGDGRRLKVYELSRLGERLAREIAARRRVSLLPEAPTDGGPAAPSPSEDVWIRPAR